MTIGIYRLIFPNTAKCYIGQSVNIERRYVQHIRDMEKGVAAEKVQQAYHMYGKPTLDIILDDINISELDTLEKEADGREKHYDVFSALVKIMNDIEEIKKSL